MDIDLKVKIFSLVFLLLFIIPFNYATVYMGTDHKDIHYNTFEGKDITATIFFPQDMNTTEKHPVTILLHDYMYNRKMLFGLAINLARKGIISIAVDFEKDIKDIISYEERQQALYQDLNATIEYILGISYIDTTKIAIIGHGIGAVIAINSSIAQPNIFKVVIGISPWKYVKNFTSSTPSDLLIVCGAFEDNDVLDASRNIIKDAVGDEIKENQEYQVNGFWRMFMVDTDANHISLLYDSDVVQAVETWIERRLTESEEQIQYRFNFNIANSFVGFAAAIFLAVIVLKAIIKGKLSKEDTSASKDIRNMENYLTLIVGYFILGVVCVIPIIWLLNILTPISNPLVIIIVISLLQVLLLLLLFEHKKIKNRIEQSLKEIYTTLKDKRCLITIVYMLFIIYMAIFLLIDNYVFTLLCFSFSDLFAFSFWFFITFIVFYIELRFFYSAIRHFTITSNNNHRLTAFVIVYKIGLSLVQFSVISMFSPIKVNAIEWKIFSTIAFWFYFFIPIIIGIEITKMLLHANFENYTIDSIVSASVYTIVLLSLT